ncbi:unnamed protein product [Dracunculus medinensis]|uniref:Uncharacterized protein n=1 Tax=Dracunculus medinensis TaxID=318479 RepID=A0A158Q310_DRAME|nr:unnamed protein product [Dracunculus medinensis]
MLCFDSWVELPPPSRASSCNSDMSVLDQDSVKDGPRLVTPSTMATLGNALENLKMLPQNKGDWILDWSSHPEARESLIQCTPNQSTPPNSPIPGDMNFVGIFSCGCNTENDYPLFVGFIITHVISFFIGLTAGMHELSQLCNCQSVMDNYRHDEIDQCLMERLEFMGKISKLTLVKPFSFFFPSTFNQSQ